MTQPEPTPPPEEIAFVARLVDQRLAEVLNDEKLRWSKTDPRLKEAIVELERMSIGGKRLRAAFCYWAWCGADDGTTTESVAIDAGAAFELLHTFALIHDDIMDDADTRRGEATIHTSAAQQASQQQWRGEPRRYGEGVAILIGDLSHVYADRLIGTDFPQARSLWDELRIELNLGQYLDMRTATEGAPDLETARRIATFKTALYTIVRPMQVGAAFQAKGASEELLARIDSFGRPVGQAFQLRDDLLGVLGKRSHIGKPIAADLREGKVTELMAIALNRASSSQKEVLAKRGDPNIESSPIADIIDILHTTGAVEEVETRIHVLTQRATKASSDLPFDIGIRKTLVSLAQYVASRTH